jgi:hypothetical protein
MLLLLLLLLLLLQRHTRHATITHWNLRLQNDETLKTLIFPFTRTINAHASHNSPLLNPKAPIQNPKFNKITKTTKKQVN